MAVQVVAYEVWLALRDRARADRFRARDRAARERADMEEVL